MASSVRRRSGTRLGHWLTTPVPVPRWTRIAAVTVVAMQCVAWLLQGAAWALTHLAN